MNFFVIVLISLMSLLFISYSYSIHQISLLGLSFLFIFFLICWNTRIFVSYLVFQGLHLDKVISKFPFSYKLLIMLIYFFIEKCLLNTCYLIDNTLRYKIIYPPIIKQYMFFSIQVMYCFICKVLPGTVAYIMLACPTNSFGTYEKM